jgi:hypothetical protein
MPSVWRRSGLVEFDNNGDVGVGAKAFFYAGATTTPITVYQDAAETTPRTQPVTADANGRWPLTFIPYRADYDEKVTDSEGTQLSYYQSIPNADPVDAASDTALPEELIATGDFMFRLVGGTRTGFVRANGRTLGNVASGATERANADTEDLFTHLWNGLANGQAAVSGGRGASAAADYAANKVITLPNMQGAFPVGIDDMGALAGGYFVSATFTHGNATTAGSLAGANTHTLIAAELAAHTHAAGSLAGDSGGAHTHTLVGGSAASGGAHTHTASDSGHTHAMPNVNAAPAPAGSASSFAQGTGGSQQSAATFFASANVGSGSAVITVDSGGAHTHTLSGTADSGGAHTHTVSGSTASSGSGTPHNNLSRCLLGTWYIKL